jgi:nucleoside-diphosphate-sugar epimerase
MNILVLGSSGQVGAYLVDHLKSKGHEVQEFDIVNDIDQDLRYETEKIVDAIKQTDFVFFLAFDVGGSRYLSKYQHTFEFINNNIKMMDNVFNLLHGFNKPFIFASSQMSNMSYSPYGVLKATGECYTKALKGLVVKFWNVYGIERDPEKSHVITDFIIKAVNTGVIDMMTDGQESREFLYAEDCSEALEAVMNNYWSIPVDEELHITSFSETKIIEIADMIAYRTGSLVVPAVEKDMVQMDKKNVANPAILKYWKPKTSINDGIGKIIEGMYGSII